MSPLAKLRAMESAYADMIANAAKFDGSYEAARDQFATLQRVQS